MEIRELKARDGLETIRNLERKYEGLNKLLDQIRVKDVPEPQADEINAEIDLVNRYPGTDRHLLRLTKKAQRKILAILVKELKWTPKNYHRNLWMAIGMSAFGIPLGVAFGVSLQSMAFIGIGLPIGLAIGLAIGTEMDKKAANEGRQLDVDIEY